MATTPTRPYLVSLHRKATLQETRAGFIADALAASAETVESGEGYAAAEVHTYISARMRGKIDSRLAKPKARPWLS